MRMTLVPNGEHEVQAIPLMKFGTDISPKSEVLTGAAT
jgi:hypothetical protein